MSNPFSATVRRYAIACPICGRIPDCMCERRELLISALELGCSDRAFDILKTLERETLAHALFYVLDMAQAIARAPSASGLAFLSQATATAHGLRPEDARELGMFAGELALALRRENGTNDEH